MTFKDALKHFGVGENSNFHRQGLLSLRRYFTGRMRDAKDIRGFKDALKDIEAVDALLSAA